MRQAPTKIKNIYYEPYIGKEKEFLELLLYIQMNNNIDEVISAIEQLKAIRLDHVSTERMMNKEWIYFVLESSTTTSSS